MRYLIPSKTLCFFYVYIGTILIYLENHSVKCHDEIVIENWAHNKGYLAVCDKAYRRKYFKNKRHREAVQAAILFVPPPNIPKDDVRIIEEGFEGRFERIEKNKQRHQQPNYLNSRKFALTGRNFSDNYDYGKILEARRNYFNSSKEKQLEVMRRKIISKNKCYKRKKPNKKKPGRRKVRRNGSKFSRRNNRHRFHNRGKKRHSSRRWGDYGDYGDDWDQNICKSLRRIAGGQNAVSAEILPYMVFVDTGCGGGIISDKFVITAGHCIDEHDEPKYVHVGSVKLLSGCQYQVVYIWIHPQYSRKEIQNDISLLKVNPPFVWSPAIQPIKMSSKKAVEKTCGIVAGWGAEAYKGFTRLNLAMATIPVISRRKCRKYGIRTSQFCGGYDDGSVDTCQGDSGGPFVVNGFLVGIVSYGYKCARPHSPGVYEDVSYHRDWIRSITGL